MHMKLVKLLTVAGLMVTALAMTSWASGNEVKGTLNAVDVAGLTVTVNNQVYSVSANVAVKVKDQGYIPFSQLPNYVGQWAELKLTAQGLVYKIEVKAGSGGGGKAGKLTGTLQAVDTATRTITVNTQTFTVSPSVVIEVKQGKQKSYISFEQLPSYIGKLVEIKYDTSQVVYKIEVKS
jgi:hypothetical protein